MGETGTEPFNANMIDYAAYSDAKLKGAQNTMEIKENNSRAAMVTH